MKKLSYYSPYALRDYDDYFRQGSLPAAWGLCPQTLISIDSLKLPNILKKIKFFIFLIFCVRRVIR
jgi:hypothetical protein